MSEESYPREDELRRTARKRLEARQGFWWMVVVWIVVNGGLTVVWYVTGPDHYFWPMWPMFGIGIGLVFAGVAAFVPGLMETTPDDVDREVERMKRKQGM